MSAARSTLRGGECHSLAITEKYELRCWGRSGFYHDPLTCDKRLWQRCTSVGAGCFASVLVSDGAVVGWERDINPETTPEIRKHFHGLPSFVAVSAGYDHLLALREDGVISPGVVGTA